MSSEFIDDSRLRIRLDAMPAAIRSQLVPETYALAQDIRTLAQHKLSGEVLNVRTGFLRSHVFADVKDSEVQVIGEVFTSGVPYAAIHEFGGRTPAHEIVARGKALAFMMGGQQVFAKRVQHPGSIMPERSYMRSSLREKRTEIVERLTGAVKRGAGRS